MGRRLHPRFLLIMLAAVVAAGVIALLDSDFALAAGGRTPAPKRDGMENWNCPPSKPGGSGGWTKIEPTDPKDKDVNGDGRKDYYGGEWKFDDPATGKDLIVRQWCIDGPGLNSAYWSLEIITSMNGVETPRVAPGSPT